MATKEKCSPKKKKKESRRKYRRIAAANENLTQYSKPQHGVSKAGKRMEQESGVGVGYLG